MLQVFWLVIVVLLTYLLGDTDSSSIEHQSCVFTVNNCNYTLTLEQEKTCPHGSQTSRKRRSYDIHGVTHAEPGQADRNYIDNILSKLKRTERKLTKEMRDLSTRVLRGTRRMAIAISNLTKGQMVGRSCRSKNGCPSGFESVPGWTHCYLLSHFNTTWYEAQDICSTLGSDMLSLDTMREHYAVTFLIRNNPDYNQYEGWWTGGTFVVGTKQWMWANNSDKHPFLFIKWASEEPNENSSQCMLLSKHDNLLWHDDICTEKHNFICKVSGQ